MTKTLIKTWEVAFGNSKRPCRNETDAKLLARQLVKKGQPVTVHSLEEPPRVIEFHQVAAWLHEA